MNKTPFLIQSEDGRVVSRTLCTSHHHYDAIVRDFLLKMDPFHNFGNLTIAIGRPPGNR